MYYMVLRYRQNITMYLSNFILTSVLSMTWTKYDTGFPVHDTARPLGLSSETRSIVPMSKMPNRKIYMSACENTCILKETLNIKFCS